MEFEYCGPPLQPISLFTFNYTNSMADSNFGLGSVQNPTFGSGTGDSNSYQQMGAVGNNNYHQGYMMMPRDRPPIANLSINNGSAKRKVSAFILYIQSRKADL